MRTVLIYPFGKESEIIAKYPEQLCDLKPLCFVGLKGWEHTYESIRNCFEVLFDFESALNEAEPEVVWFVKFSDNLDFNKFYLPYLKLAIEKHLQIIIDCHLMQYLDDSLINQIEFYKPSNILQIEGEEDGEVLCPINKPIIYISGFYGELKKTELLLAVRKRLNEYGVAATYVSANGMANYFGVHSLTDKIIKDNISDQSKVMMINTGLKKIEENETTDLIIVAVPGEMFCVSKKFLSNMGFLTYDFFVAARPDILITNLPYSNYSEKDLNIIRKMIAKRFDVNVDVFCRINKRLLLQDTELDQQYTYLTVSEENIDNIQSEDDIYDYHQDNVDSIVDKCLERLCKYGEMDII